MVILPSPEVHVQAVITEIQALLGSLPDAPPLVSHRVQDFKQTSTGDVDSSSSIDFSWEQTGFYWAG